VSNSLPDYVSPPVIEVVGGVGFAPVEGFKAVHIGLLWEVFRDQFPNVEEHPPIVMPLEVLDRTGPPIGEVQFVETPPLPRIWFVDSTGNGIVQVQREALLHNWRKLKDGDQYPRYNAVISEFRDHFARFTKFVEEHRLGKVLPMQYELNYVNHIFSGEYWTPGKTLNSVFPDFQWRSDGRRFLPTAYEAVNWKTVVRLPNDAGRLHITIQTAFKRTDNSPLLILEMKARGMAKDQSPESIWRWFDLAHEWIVRGFADITDKKIQQTLWGLKA
jgi:uncharacterized protein (TIGR04255 family)